jgi:hypothetical protein
MSPWNYRSTDGVGLLEFLTWCEDLNMEPIVGIYAGLHLDGGRTTITGDALKPFASAKTARLFCIIGALKSLFNPAIPRYMTLISINYKVRARKFNVQGPLRSLTPKWDQTQKRQGSVKDLLRRNISAVR